MKRGYLFSHGISWGFVIEAHTPGTGFALGLVRCGYRTQNAARSALDEALATSHAGPSSANSGEVSG